MSARCSKCRKPDPVVAAAQGVAGLDVGVNATEVHTAATLGEAAAYTASALDVQEGGDHYKSLPIQPVQYIHANGIPFAEGSVIKYVTRWRDKGGIADLKKARHFLDLLIELESKAAQEKAK